MARFTEFDTKPIYEVGQLLLERCLQGDGSLIQQDATLWTLANLEKIHEKFVLAPDEGDRTFMEKFEGQIRPAGSDICKLAGEILAVYFLFPSSVGESRKKERIEQVLSWAGESLPPDSLLSRALKEGIGSGGQGYNTRRPFEIKFIIEFAIAWKRLSQSDRSEAVLDPWRFMDILDAVDGAEAAQVRHMLLHILFPESFERIASRDHKRKILAAFTSVLDGDIHEDTDRRLLDIRTRLSELLGNEELDFYRAPLEDVWKDTSESTEASGSMEALRYKKQIVLYGPPGTGKTYSAKKIADRLIRSALLRKFGPREYFKKAKEGGIDVDISRRIHQQQLHPAYGYEDFVQGLHLNGNGATEYKLGYLPNLVDSMSTDDLDIPHVLILDEMNRTDLSRMLGECFSLLENRDEVISLRGQDSSGQSMKLSIPGNLFIIGTMNLIDQSVEQIDFALRRRFLWEYCPFSAEDLVAAAKYRWSKLNSRIPWGKIEGDFYKLSQAAEALNKKIKQSSLLGEQYEIGHAYLLDTVIFLREDIEGCRPHTFLWDKRGKAKRPVEQTWELSLKPLILEYLAGLDEKSRKKEINDLANEFLYVSVESD